MPDNYIPWWVPADHPSRGAVADPDMTAQLDELQRLASVGRQFEADSRPRLAALEPLRTNASPVEVAAHDVGEVMRRPGMVVGSSPVEPTAPRASVPLQVAAEETATQLRAVQPPTIHPVA
jgi:hypothetical protein